MKKVMVFGTFDGIHEGHSNLFKQAKKYGGYLIVIIARDKNVKKFKKRLAIRNEKQRLNDVKKVKLVDRAILGNLNNPYKKIIEIKPDVICLGYDQNSYSAGLGQKLKKLGSSTKICRLKPYQPKKYHSSNIKI